MSKTTAAALTLALTCSSLLVACTGDAPKTTPPPPANTAPAANANANTAAAPKPVEMKVAGMPADTQPIFATKCSGCHGADATGKPPAPNIFEVKDKHTPEIWVKYLEDPRSVEKGSTMPKIPLTDEERRKLSEWLSVTTGGGAKAGEKPEPPKVEKPETKKS